jgi:hypothetical protein
MGKKRRMKGRFRRGDPWPIKDEKGALVDKVFCTIPFVKVANGVHATNKPKLGIWHFALEFYERIVGVGCPSAKDFATIKGEVRVICNR